LFATPLGLSVGPDGAIHTFMNGILSAHVYGQAWRIDPITLAGTRLDPATFVQGVAGTSSGGAFVAYIRLIERDIPGDGVLDRVEGGTVTLLGTYGAGPLAVAPDVITPARSTTWGALKARWR
jgi:hypothetical protein